MNKTLKATLLAGAAVSCLSFAACSKDQPANTTTSNTTTVEQPATPAATTTTTTTQNSAS